MIFGLLTLITALSISAVAIYYSVAGLMAIFAAAALPIMIMGGVLEIGKLVTAVWLHKYWKQATWWLKSYLSVAVVVLMFITSMGIFGFLSSAHIEQTSASTESVARVESITGEIARQNSIIERAETRVKQLESSGTGSDANVQSQIDKEQERIDNAYARIQPAIDEQNKIIGSQAKLFQDELDRIDTAMRTVAGYIDSGDKENYQKAQAIIGVKPDGAFGSGSTRAYTAWKDAKNAERQVLLTNIQQATNNPQARAAAAEIKRLRTTVETQIAESNKLINRLRANIGTTDNSAQIQADIDEQQERIRLANAEIDTLSQERVELEAVYRKLEAEVGPIKYIAEFVYGDTADKNLMEEAVRWVIIVIIFVFDPLAVLLLIAAQYTFEFRKKEQEDDRGERLRLEREEYERARAQRIVDNPGVTFDDPAPASDANSNEDPHKPGWMFEKEEVDDVINGFTDEPSDRDKAGSTDIRNGNQSVEDTSDTNGEIKNDDQSIRAGSDGGNNSNRMDNTQEGNLNDNNTINETVDTTEHEPMGETLPEQVVPGHDETDIRVEQAEVQHDGPNNSEAVEPVEKKELKSPEELKREAEYDLKEQDTNFQVSKTAWKDANPDQTLKHYKNLYVKGLIDSLPWEQPAQEDNYNTSEGYQQNAEQSESTLFNKLSKK